MLNRTFVTLLHTVASIGIAQANLVTTELSFAALDGVVPPADPATGTMVWDAASASAPFNSTIPIGLTINGHSYSLGEVRFLWVFGEDTERIIEDTLNDINEVHAVETTEESR